VFLLTKVATFLERMLALVSLRASNIGVSVLLIMGLLVVVDVILRRTFNSPLSFSLEIIEIMLVVVVFFCVAYTGAQRGHVSIDVIVSRFPPKAQAIVSVFIYFLSFGLFGIICWGSIIYGLHIQDIGQGTGILGVPYYPFVFVVAFGSLLLALVILSQLLNSIINLVNTVGK
jgi:TRAP-type C4-dicarboxylate transport system permease small subunit